MTPYTVRIVRWDTYDVPNVDAESAQQAEERALEIFDEVECEHVDGGVQHVEAHPCPPGQNQSAC